MKTLMIILSILLISFSAVAQNQIQSVKDPRFLKEGEVFFGKNTGFLRTQAIQDGRIKSVNNWDFLGMFSSWTDSIRTKSFIDSEGQGQVFGSYGTTSFPTGSWAMQSTWVKAFYPNLVTPDTVSIDAKFIGGEISKVRRISMRIAVQYGDNLYAMLIDKTIPMDSQWVTLSWDMAHTKDFGIKLISLSYLAFQFYDASDSSLVGGDILVKNLRGINSNGKSFNIDFPIVISVVPELKQVPSGFALEQNYPNPFNPSTTIRFTVPEREYVNLSVYNSLGQQVKNLIDQEQGQGRYKVSFDGSYLPSGTYFYKLQTGANVEVKKMILLK